MRIRIYGKQLNTWETTDENGRQRLEQVELAYTDYNADGTIAGTGSEDFSMARWSQDIEERWVYTWDGVKRNKGGYRWFTDRGHIRFRKSCKKDLAAMLKEKYNAEIIELRK